ncbi:MAG: SCO family protein [Rhizobiaceae bacterium]
MKLFRYAVWAGIFVLGAFLAYSTVNWTINNTKDISSSMKADIGGPFSAVRSDGTPITYADIVGRPHVMFFGFTHCPDVCPTTLYEASLWLEALGDDGDKVDVYFITVDPERDTADIMDSYLSSFGGRIKGITGTKEQMDQLLRNWRVYAEKVPTEDDYTMNHTATTYLMNSKGEFVGTIAYGEDKETAIKKLRKLVVNEG